MSAQRLTRLLDLARGDSELHTWLQAGVQRWREGERLEHALALAGPRATMIRNLALRRAAGILDPRGELSAWQRAVELANAVHWFERKVWPKVCGSETADLAPLEQALFDAFSACPRRLRSPNKLLAILR